MKVVMLQKGRTSPIRFHIQGFQWIKAHDPWKVDSLKVLDRIQSFQYFVNKEPLTLLFVTFSSSGSAHIP